MLSTPRCQLPPRRALGARAQLIRQRVVSSPSCLISGAHARGDSQDRPSPSENGASLGRFCFVWDDGFAQFPGHQVAGLWPLWLEDTPAWHSCRGQRLGSWTLSGWTRHRKKWAGVKPAGDGGQGWAAELGWHPHRCLLRVQEAPSAALPVSSSSPLLNERFSGKFLCPDPAAPRGGEGGSTSGRCGAGSLLLPGSLWASLGPPTARDVF